MKLHACRHCGSRLRIYTEHLKTHPNVCVTCYRVFSNRSILLAHTCKVEEHLCVLTVRKQNWLDIKEKRHATTHYHRKRNVKSRCHRSRTWKRHHITCRRIRFRTSRRYYTKLGVVSEHTRVTDQSSHDKTSSDEFGHCRVGTWPYFSQIKPRPLN